MFFYILLFIAVRQVDKSKGLGDIFYNEYEESK